MLKNQSWCAGLWMEKAEFVLHPKGTQTNLHIYTENVLTFQENTCKGHNKKVLKLGRQWQVNSQIFQ